MRRFGGADSDVMLDMILRCGGRGKTDFVFYNTGLEYRATLEHLDELEKKYDVEIIRCKPIKSIPLSVKEYGLPFVSKAVSQNIYSLQRHNFKWEDDTIENLMSKYDGCSSYLKWWTDAKVQGRDNRFSVSRNKYLKEFLIQNPPEFKISAKCCDYAKKNPSHDLEKRKNYDLKCLGVRRAEGGIRSTTYKTCFSEAPGTDQFRPVWWLRDGDKVEYCKHYGVVHSRCYTEYGMRRTGCCGCPYAIDFEENLERMRKYEPNLYNAAIHIFGQSYEYTRQYRAFRDEMKQKEKEVKKKAEDGHGA